MLSKKDSDLFLELINNSRQSNRKLSKKVGLTKETIAAKISYFKEQNYIRDYSLSVNYHYFSLKEYNVFIKFKNFSENLSNDFFDYLISHSNTTWIGKCFGSYDCKVSFLANDDSLANFFINEIYENFYQLIQKLDLLVIIDKYKAPSSNFISTLLGREFNLNKEYVFNDAEVQKISEIDKEIIFLLGQNPNQPYVDIGTSLNLSGETISYKIKQLEKKNVLLGNSIVVDGNKFNKIWGIGLFLFKPNKVYDIKEKIQSTFSVTSYVESLGVWNISITFFASSLNSLYEEYNNLKSIFGEDILNSDFVFIIDFYKYPKIPKCILE